MSSKKSYQPPEAVWVGSAIELTKGGQTPLADIPGDASGGYNRGWGKKPDETPKKKTPSKPKK